MCRWTIYQWSPCGLPYLVQPAVWSGLRGRRRWPWRLRQQQQQEEQKEEPRQQQQEEEQEEPRQQQHEEEMPVWGWRSGRRHWDED